MIRTTSPETCDHYSEALSAFVDGELAFPEALAAVDHLATCDTCRRTYLESRALAERLVSAPAPAAPEAVWQRLSAAGTTPSEPASGPLRVAGRRRTWALGAAAAAVVVLALSIPRLVPSGRPEAAPEGTSKLAGLKEIVVEGARGRMTDDRFVSLLGEILSADRKYHRETERVLRLVRDREPAAESGDRESPAEENAEPSEDETEEAAPRVPNPLPS